MKALLAVTAVLFSTALLLLGHGMQLTLLPMRASGLGMSEFLVGLSASCYFGGFVVGCMFVPRIIVRVGHIRCFSVLASLMIVSLLSLELLDQWPAWLVLRFTTGVAVSSLYAVIESWLNGQAQPQTRGRILATYTFITLAAMAVGQLLINVGPVMSSTPFILATIFMALSILPVGLTRGMAPTPPESTRVRFSLLYRRSRPAFLGALLSGLVAGSFWSLGALFAGQFSAEQSAITWFMTTAIVGGAVFQYPLGWLSDRFDRRLVLSALAMGSAACSCAVALSVESMLFLPAVFLFGATALPIYAVSLAVAADVTGDDEFVEIGTSVLLLNALGAVAAPLALGQLMTQLGPTSLYWSFSLLSLLFSLLIYFLSRTPREIKVEQQTPFKPAVMDMAPGSFELDPRGTPHEQGDIEGEH